MYARGYYGTLKPQMARAIYQRYMGWYGRPTRPTSTLGRHSRMLPKPSAIWRYGTGTAQATRGLRQG